MPEQLQKRFQSIFSKWTGLTRDQKLKIVIAVIVLMTSLAAFMYISMKPKMVTLMSDLSYTDLGEVQSVLDNNGIKYVTKDTTIFVDEKDMSNSMVYLANENVPTSNTGFTYLNAFENSGMTATDSVKRESFILASESKIADSLKRLDGVVDAQVDIIVPENKNYFIRDQIPATASVTLTTNKTISQSEGLIMARLVAMSVEGLSTDNIEITDQNFTPIYSGVSQNSPMTSASTAYEQEQLRARDVENAVKRTLAPLFSDVIVNATVAMDWNEAVESSTTYDNPDETGTNTGFIGNIATDKSSYENTTPGDVPGTATNGQAVTYNTNGTDSSSATTSSGQTSYIYNVKDSQIKKQVGVVNFADSSMSVTVYNSKIYDQKTLRDSGALDGISWQEYKESIPQSTPMAIDESIVANIQAGTGITNVNIIGYEVPRFIDEEIVPIDTRQIIMFVVLALLILILAVGLIRNTQKEEITEIEPELSVEDLLLSTQLEEEKEIQRLKEIEFNSENETKKQIDKFVVEKPDAVAQLLRNWLSEDWE